MFGLAVLTVSTSGFPKGNRDDSSGEAIKERLVGEEFQGFFAMKLLPTIRILSQRSLSNGLTPTTWT
ncbi:MAG: hypothetical protein CM1200mP22_17840 [Dehalococcoidia bacterium]|nr:MAG: hypothetical protein CM1200mP22_17840 [Dehalococcoidia bacterium]